MKHENGSHRCPSLMQKFLLVSDSVALGTDSVFPHLLAIRSPPAPVARQTVPVQLNTGSLSNCPCTTQHRLPVKLPVYNTTPVACQTVPVQHNTGSLSNCPRTTQHRYPVKLSVYNTTQVACQTVPIQHNTGIMSNCQCITQHR